MTDQSPGVSLRSRIIGALLRDARLSRGKSPEQCAQSIGIALEKYEDYELGLQAPSLPEIEAVAHFLEIPLDHFWSKKSLSSGTVNDNKINHPVLLIHLRQKMIGALLRKARLEIGLSTDDLANRTGFPESTIQLYELGELPVPIPHLEILATVLNRSIRDFQDQYGPIGNWIARQMAIKDFQNLPADIQLFVSKPVNRPYIDLAIRLSGMSVEKLRSLAEVLLEITY